jgi:hypothetical protein
MLLAGVVGQALGSDEQLDVGIGSVFEEGGSTADLALRNEVLTFEAKDIHGHLTTDQADIEVDGHLA